MKDFCVTVVPIKPSSKPRAAPCNCQACVGHLNAEGVKTAHHEAETDHGIQEPPVEGFTRGLRECSFILVRSNGMTHNEGGGGVFDARHSVD
jgi:hypothetical protein